MNRLINTRISTSYFGILAQILNVYELVWQNGDTLICQQSSSLLHYAKLLEQIHVNTSGVPQKVKHYSLKTIKSVGGQVQICTVASLSSVHQLRPPYGIRRQVCTQPRSCLSTGAPPQSSGTSAEFVKAAISACGERRERIAESNGKCH